MPQNEHGQNEHGQNEHGQNEHGQNEHGQNEHGQNEHGQNEHGQPVGQAATAWKSATRPTGQMLIGRTVRLEALAMAHAEELYAGVRSAPPGHWTYMPWGPFDTTESYAEWVERAVAADDIEYLAICTPEGRALGVAGYLNIVPVMGSIEVGGITYSPELQGTVLATEAMYLMMAHALDDLGYRRYEWKCDSLNAPSRAAAERLGFLYEGTFAQHLVIKGRNRDTSWFGLTNQRWRDLVGPALRAWLTAENFTETGSQRRRLHEFRSRARRAATSNIDQIADTLETMPAVLQKLLAPFDHETLATRPAPGEWCPLEVIGHLIACDSAAFRDRIQAIIAGEPDIASFDAWEAINARDFAAQPLDALLSELSNEREASATLLRSLSQTDLAKSASFHDGQRFEANDFVHEWPFHDQDHLQQILDALKSTYLPHMTATMRDALTL